MSTLRLPTGVVGNREVSNTDGQQITADKLWHLTKCCERFDMETSTTVATKTVVLFQADKAGKLADDLHAACITDGTTGSVTFDIKKNGTTVLTGVITVNSSTGDAVPVAGVFASAAAQAYAVNDVITCVMTRVSSGDQAGPMLNYGRLEQGD